MVFKGEKEGGGGREKGEVGFRLVSVKRRNGEGQAAKKKGKGHDNANGGFCT